MTTRANLLLGEDYEGWEGFCDTLVNYLKNNWRMSDPVSTLSLAKPGMIASDSDDNKLWHRVDVASGYCWQSGAPEWDEVLQANYSCDIVPKFKGVDYYDTCCGDYSRICGVDEPGLGHRLTVGLDETARALVVCDLGDINTDLGLSAQNDPTLFLVSADASAWFTLCHDGTNAILEASSGYLFPQNDFLTDRWLEHVSNTFFGIDVAGAGNLAHGSGDEGYYNSAFGNQVLYSITTGQYNSAFGYASLYSTTAGSYNSAFGYMSLYSNTAYSNSAFGYQSLYCNINGSYNSAFSYQSLYSNVGGEGNSAFGHSSLYSNTNGDHNSALGHAAARSVTTGSLSCFFGRNAGRYQSDGSTGLETPENSIYIGANSKSGSNPAGGEDDITNEIVIGYNATGNGANTIQLGNSNITEFHCQVALTVDSDRRIKRDITPLSGGLAFINALKPITYRRLNPADWPDGIKPAEYKDREIEEFDEAEGKFKKRIEKALPRPDDVDHVELGLVAQEVEEVLNAQGLDYNIVNTNPMGRKSLKYATLVVPLIKAVQELSARVAALEARRAN